ncbi:MAG: hypothetical protein HDR11_15825 [Lachnospiraceae bacterium]|nr:hypothetical protein [Lachnospiraceae bacterium]
MNDAMILCHGMYIVEDSVSWNELAEKWGISQTTKYNNEKIAIKRLSTLILGADSSL